MQIFEMKKVTFFKLPARIIFLGLIDGNKNIYCTSP